MGVWLRGIIACMATSIIDFESTRVRAGDHMVRVSAAYGMVRTSNMRAIVPIDEPYAKRNIGLVFRADAPEKVFAFVKHMKSNGSGVFSGNAFVPCFLFSEDVFNLHIQG